MGLDDPQARDYWGEIMVKEFNFPALENLVPYRPGQSFQNGEITLEVLPAAGHTPGHSCFYFPRQELLFLADVTSPPFDHGMVTSPPPWRILRPPWGAWPALRPQLISPPMSRGFSAPKNFRPRCLPTGRPSPPGRTASLICSKPPRP